LNFVFLRELSETKTNMTAALAQTGQEMDIVRPTGITQGIVDQILEKSDMLQRWRKNEKPRRPEGLATKQQIGALEETKSTTLHSPSDSGILAVALNPLDSKTIFTAGVDSNILCTNRETFRVEATMQGHRKKVLALKAHKENPVLISGSSDKTIGIWNQRNGNWSLAFQPSFHTGAVNDISLHPLNDYYVSCSDDGTWAFNNISRGEVVQQVPVGGNKTKVGCVQLHPDGRLLGTGDNQRRVQIWQLNDQSSIHSLPEADSAITSLCFSENGYHLAVACQDGVVNVYDLRKTNLLHQFESPGSTVHKVQYDYSGQYLACAGPDIRIYQTKSKSWNLLKALDNHTKPVMDIAWGPNAAYLASVSKDRCLKTYSF